MITTQISNSRPARQAILADEIEALTVVPPQVIDKGDYCWCSRLCPSGSTVFAGTTDKTNDHTSFVFRLISSADTISFSLQREGIEVAVLTDNSYGDFYSFTNFSGQLIRGYLLDWKPVYDAFGAGNYRLVTTITVLGLDYEYESELFTLMAYNELAADMTVRIEGYQNGYTESQDINFTKMNWYSQVRLPGTFKNRQPEFTTSNYKNSLRSIKQIQDEIQDVTELELPGLSDDQKDFIVYQVLLANRIIITDYSIDNNDRYKPFEVYPDADAISKLDYRVNEPGASLLLKFRNKQENIIKRNLYF